MRSKTLVTQAICIKNKNEAGTNVALFKNTMSSLENNKPSFIVDVHLGKLARTLRMLGFDTLYNNSYTKNDLIQIALADKRLLCTKNVALEKFPGVTAIIINSADPMQQLLQVVNDLSLVNNLIPFSRCLVCNGELKMVQKEEIKDALLLKTKLYYNEFWQCTICKKIYWKGPHYERMMALVENLKTGKNLNSTII